MTAAMQSISTDRGERRAARAVRTAGAPRLLRAVLDLMVRWSEAYYGPATEFSARLEQLPPERRIEAALRWHAGHTRQL